MHHRLVLIAAASLVGSSVSAQSNTVSGLDGNLFNIDSPRYWGRRGASHPNGEIGFSSANYMCNPGTVTIPWYSAGSGGPMGEDHPKFGFMIVRLAGDRLVQVSDRSFVKHAFTSLNTPSGPCIPCTDPGTGSVMGIGCSDAYQNNHNGDRYWLGPADEINPWLASWSRVGSYFDRGDPAVSGAAATDGTRSLTQSMTFAMDAVKNRVTIKEQDLLVTGAQFFSQIQLLHQGESVTVRGNNFRTRGVSFTWTGTTWSVGNVGSSAANSVLDRWPGASTGIGGNGTDDGRFRVAVKVTGPVDGRWHYEYAVHNIDNHRGGATLRIPKCLAARAYNVGFRDIDSDALNEWLATDNGSELVFTAPASNPQKWNTLFNFWFDSEGAPVAGDVTIDQALIGPGALSVAVPSQVPGFVPVTQLGDGCGAPAITVAANGIASIPNPAFAVVAATAPTTGVFAFFSFGARSTLLGGSCVQYLDNASLGTLGFVLTNTLGTASIPLAIPGGIAPFDFYVQAVSLVSPGTGAVLGDFNLSNGIGIRVGGSGCP